MGLKNTQEINYREIQQDMTELNGDGNRDGGHYGEDESKDDPEPEPEADKKYGEERKNFSVIVNMEKGEIEIYKEMTVVDKVADPVEEIHIDELYSILSDLNQGKISIESIKIK